MPINPDAVGQESDPVSTSWTSKDALLYAVGIGAGTDELAFTTENTSGVDQQVFPTFAVVLGWGMGSAMRGIGSVQPGHARARRAARDAAQAHPAGGLGHADAASSSASTTRARPPWWPPRPTATDDADGSPLYTLYSSAFIRGEGGWGGDRGPSGPRNVPPERGPDHAVTYQTSPDQALVYRLSGDRNPLHSDPAFAAMGGFDRPILHGLCTYGFTGRALLHTLCGSDPARFQPHGGPLLLAGPARRRPDRSACGARATAKPSSPRRSRTAPWSSTRARVHVLGLIPPPRDSFSRRARRQAAELVVVDLDARASPLASASVRAWGLTTWATNMPRTGRSALSRSSRST